MTRNGVGEAVLVAVIFASMQFGVAQDKPTSVANPQTNSSSPAENDKPSGSPEGIKVHGHWLIEVRNPDGSLASHTEFDNALVQSGATLLTQVLGRTAISGNWVIILSDGGTGGPCVFNAKTWRCFISEPNDTYTGSLAPGVTAKSLTVNAPPPGTSNANDQLVLKGTATAATNSSVAVVDTNLAFCQRTDSPPPSACAFYSPSGSTVLNSWNFSHATLTTPVAVTTGQSIQITVTFTFS